MVIIRIQDFFSINQNKKDIAKEIILANSFQFFLK